MTNVAIIGYGNIGKGVELSLKDSGNEDMKLIGIFTRRDPNSIIPKFLDSSVFHMDDLLNFQGQIDVAILCGGSQGDIMNQGPEILKYFNTIDSFDVHKKIPEYWNNMKDVGLQNDHLALVACGWDPGEMSVSRFKATYLMPNGITNSFWGPGVSQGHSNALRTVRGVKYAVQYTIPKEDGLNRAYAGETPTTREKHFRDCIVVSEEGADLSKIENAIKTMPDYFEPYDTAVHFVDEQSFFEEHTSNPHEGLVLRSGKTGGEFKAILKQELKMEDNPSFTAGILVAYARACHKLYSQGERGAKTVLEVPPIALSPNPIEMDIQNFV